MGTKVEIEDPDATTLTTVREKQVRIVAAFREAQENARNESSRLAEEALRAVTRILKARAQAGGRDAFAAKRESPLASDVTMPQLALRDRLFGESSPTSGLPSQTADREGESDADSDGTESEAEEFVQADYVEFLLFSAHLMDVATRVPPSELADNPKGVKEHLMRACGERNDMSQLEHWRWEECMRFLLIVLTERARLEDQYCKEFSEGITTERSPLQWAVERLDHIKIQN